MEGVVHEDHAFLAAHLDDVFELMDLAFADEISDGAVGEEQFVGEHSAVAVDGGEEVLGDDALEGVGQLEDDLFLHGALEDADEAFEGVGDAGGVEGGEDEVAGFGGGEGGGDGLVVADFADHDDIGVLAEDMEEGAVEGADVGEDLLLDDDGLFVGVHELDGVLDGDDLAAALGVDEVDHVIEGGGLSGPGGAGDEDEAVGFEGEFVDFLGQAEEIAGGDSFAAEAEAHFREAVVAVERGADAAGDLVADGDAQLPVLLELPALVFVEQGVGHFGEVLAGEGIGVREDDLAIDPEGRGDADDEVEVGGFGVGGALEQLVEFGVGHGGGRRAAGSGGAGEAAPEAGEAAAEAGGVGTAEAVVGRFAEGVEFEGLPEGRLGCGGEAEGQFAIAALEPEDEAGGILGDGVAEDAEGLGELLVEDADAGGEPGDKPVVGGEAEGLFEAVLGALLVSRQEDVGAGEPDVGGVAAFLEGGVGEGEGLVEVAEAAEGDGFGGEQFGVVGVGLEGFIGPGLGFAELAQLDEHADLAGPGGGAFGVFLQGAGEEAEALFEVGDLEGAEGFGEVMGLVLDPFVRGEGVVLVLAFELEISEAAHGIGQGVVRICSRWNQRLKAMPRRLGKGMLAWLTATPRRPSPSTPALLATTFRRGQTNQWPSWTTREPSVGMLSWRGRSVPLTRTEPRWNSTVSPGRASTGAKATPE